MAPAGRKVICLLLKGEIARAPGAPGQALEPRSTSPGRKRKPGPLVSARADSRSPRAPENPEARGLPEAPSRGPRATQWGGKHSLIDSYLQSSCHKPGSLPGSEDGRWEQPESTLMAPRGVS